MSNDKPQDDWAEHTDELSRKTLDTLARFTKNHADDKITDREFYILVGALWDTVAGLVRKDVLRVLEEVHAELRKTIIAKRKAA